MLIYDQIVVSEVYGEWMLQRGSFRRQEIASLSFDTFKNGDALKRKNLLPLDHS